MKLTPMTNKKKQQDVLNTSFHPKSVRAKRCETKPTGSVFQTHANSNAKKTPSSFGLVISFLKPVCVFLLIGISAQLVSREELFVYGAIVAGIGGALHAHWFTETEEGRL